MADTRFLDAAVARAIHDRQLAEHGGLVGVKDDGLLESAIARPLNKLAYGESDPFVLAAAYAYGVARNHPFADGNGRTGRTLALWELYRRGFDTHYIFSVDEFYWEDRPRYYEALDAVRKQGGELTGWLEYTAEGLRLTLEKVWSRVQRLTAETGSRRMVLRPKQEKLLDMLRDHSSLTPRQIWEGLGVSKQGAMDLLNPLMEAGLVRRIGTRKSGRYILA